MSRPWPVGTYLARAFVHNHKVFLSTYVVVAHRQVNDAVLESIEAIGDHIDISAQYANHNACTQCGHVRLERLAEQLFPVADDSLFIRLTRDRDRVLSETPEALLRIVELLPQHEG